MSGSMDGLQADLSTQSLDVQQDASDLAMTSGDNIRVYVRVRPPTDREVSAASMRAVAVERGTNSLVLRGEQARHFTFDGVLAEDCSQDEVFELVGRSIGDGCLAGYNGSIYVYGQTGVGKTYTMCGPVTSLQSMQFEERRGLICRILDYVFAEIYRRRARSDSATYLCRCSFLEIYKEQIVDLLDPSSTNLQVREDVNRGIYVERLTEQTVSSLTEAFQVLWKGLQQRHVGATQMNERSSRSHAVFTLSIETSSTRAGVTSTRVARLNLVDLAGSERQMSVYHSASARVKEAGAINKSLSALTNVIMSLARSSMSRRRSMGNNQDGDGRRPFAHYRDSKLTFLLRDSLGGNSKTAIIANISPASSCYVETLSTLKFAARAKHIRCVAVRNEEFSGTVESLMSEVKSLRQQLAQLSSRGMSDTAEGTEPSALDDESQVLYSRKRAKRLEILLAAALERERLADHRRHQLQRLAEFLEDLNFRKEQYLGKVLENYSLLAAEIASVRVLPGGSEGDSEVKKKLVGFRALLGNLVSSNNHAAPREDEALVPSSSDAQSDSAAARMDEAAFLVEENKRLRRQLERHMELHRLTAEHQDLRMRLSQLDPGSQIEWRGHRSRGAASRTTTLNASMVSDDSSSGEQAPEAAPSEGVPKGQPVTAEMLLRLAESEDDSTAIRTWIYFQKMAKEVEQLLRTKECLGEVERDLRTNGRDVRGDGLAIAMPQGSSKAPESTPRRDKKDGDLVECPVIEDLAQCTQDAQTLAVSIVESMGVEFVSEEEEGPITILPIEGMDAQRGAEPKSSRAPKAGQTTNVASGDKSTRRSVGSRLTSSTPHLGSNTLLKLGKHSTTGLLSRNKSTRGLGGVTGQAAEDDFVAVDNPSSMSVQGAVKESAASGLRSAHKAQLKDAMQRVKHLYGTLDILNSAYSDVYDQFQHLREEYESRLEECQFFELQCSRLDMMCQKLVDQMSYPQRPGPAGHFSAAGLPHVSQLPSRRSLSLSSLRDTEFWEQRFRELEQITGAAAVDGGEASAQTGPMMAAGLFSRRFAGAPVRRATAGILQTPSVVSPGAICGQVAQLPSSSSRSSTMGQGTQALAHSSSLSALRSEEERARNLISQPRCEAVPPDTVRRVASAPLLPLATGLTLGIHDATGTMRLRLPTEGQLPARAVVTARPPGATATDTRSFRCYPSVASTPTAVRQGSAATSRSSSLGVARPLVLWSGAATDRRATPQAGAGKHPRRAG